VHRGDLISVDDGPRHHLGVVIDVQDRRVTVAVGVHGKRQVLPLRQIQLIWPLPQTASPPPERLNQAPWHLDAGVVAIAPERPDLAAAWQLMVSTPDPQPLGDWFALFSSEPNPQQAAELWLWLKG
jgi:hypothetical protein